MSSRAILEPRSDPREVRALAHLRDRQFVLPSTEAFAGAAVLAMAMATLVGALAVLAFIGCTAIVVARRPLANLLELLRFSPLLMLPLLTIMSTIWSDAPTISMKAGLELLLTFVAAIVLCRNMRVERLILMLFIAVGATTLAALPNVPYALASRLPLTASWGSKNAVAFFAYMLFALSLALVVDRHQPWYFRLLAIGAGVLGLFVSWLAQSGGSTALIVITVVAFPPLALLGAFKPPVRIALIVFSILLLLICALFVDDIVQAITDFRTNVLHKDATLTGRTYLWDFAARLARARPVLGYGYGAFWRRGNIDAEGLWRWGGIASRGGFNFHNAFVEMRVDMGWVGLGLLVATCAGVSLMALVRQIVSPSIPLAALMVLVGGNYVRSYAEDALLSPFNVVTLIWLAVALYAVKQRDPALAMAGSASGRFGPQRGRQEPVMVSRRSDPSPGRPPRARRTLA